MREWDVEVKKGIHDAGVGRGFRDHVENFNMQTHLLNKVWNIHPRTSLSRSTVVFILATFFSI